MTETKKTTNMKKPDKSGYISFEFTVPKSEVEKGYKDVVKEWAGTVEIKGFRKGKAPLDLVEKQLDRAKVYSHALEHILPGVYAKELKKLDIQPIIEPRITPIAMQEGQDWSFRAETSVRPEITLGDYKKYIAAANKKAPKAEKEGDNPKLNTALDAILKNAKIELSDMLVEEEAQAALNKLGSQLSQLKLSLDDYLKSIKKTKEEMIEEYKKTAENNLKIELCLSEITKDLKPEVKETDPYKKYAAERSFALDYISKL